MSDILDDNVFWKRIADTKIKAIFKPEELEVLVKIYRWTKADKNPYFFENVLKHIDGYTKALKKLRNHYFIILVKGSGPYRITEDGVLTARLVLDLQEKGFLNEDFC